MARRETFEDRRVLLTGASSGIGRELARELAARGAVLALASRREERLAELATEIESRGAVRPAVLPTDLARRGAAAELAERALDALGRVDVLVNDAAGGIQGLLWVAGDRDEARALMELNYWSPLALIAGLVPTMRERGWGAVVNVTSMSKVSPFPALGHYCASKAAVGVATEALRMELRGSGVRVTEVPLGVVDTAGSYENRTLTGAERWLDGGPKGTARSAARAIVAGVERGRPRVIHPRWVGIGHAVPALARHFAARHARHADLDDRAVHVAGSAGDERQRAAREEWERRQDAA
jgi:short-subunit dehydrogenase